MDFSQIADAANRACREKLNMEVHPHDSMYTGGKSWYVPTGQSALRKILSGLALSRLGRVGSILDLGCGYGRVARHLRAAFPDAILSFCDVEKEAVDFCADAFHGVGIYSDPDPYAVPLKSCYDVIWIGSLFTHLSEARTLSWLQRLMPTLNMDGIIVASFHGPWTIEMHKIHPIIDEASFISIREQYNTTGWGFVEYGGQPNWGISISRPSKIIAMASELAGCRILSYVERGWADNHDVLTIAKTDREEIWSEDASDWC